ncbi:MAG: hypothetical protein ABL931_07640 [Usitatibacteraceae bacterium]
MEVATVRVFDQFLLRTTQTLVAKFRSMPRHFVWGSLLCFSVLAWPFESSRIQHQLVDAETGKAITNAVGVYYVLSHSGSLGGGGGKQTNRVLVEARADNQGPLDFSPQWIAPCLIGVCSNHSYPHIYIFAPGYLPKDLTNPTDPSPFGLWTALQWPANGSVVMLERPSSGAQYLEKLDYLQRRMSEVWVYAVNDGVQCDWDRIPQMLTSIHLESWYRRGPGRGPYTDGLNPSGLSQTLVSLRNNELNAGEPHRSRIASCKKVLDVLDKTPILCKDGSAMKESRWEYVPLPSSGALNVFGVCAGSNAPVALIAENVERP